MRENHLYNIIPRVLCQPDCDLKVTRTLAAKAADKTDENNVYQPDRFENHVIFVDRFPRARQILSAEVVGFVSQTQSHVDGREDGGTVEKFESLLRADGGPVETIHK